MSENRNPLTNLRNILFHAPQMVVHHYPSPQRDNAGRQKIVIRNPLWVAWLRLPLPAALKQTRRISRSAPNRQVMKAASINALHELPWVCRERKVLPPDVEARYNRLRA